MKIKKHLFSTIITILAGALIISCSEFNSAPLDVSTIEEGSLQQITITIASSDGEGSTADSRVAVADDWSTSWEEGDELLAWSTDGSTSEFAMVDGSFSAKASTFSGVVSSDYFRLIYPYSQYSSISGNQYIADCSSQSSGATLSYMTTKELSSASSTTQTTSPYMMHIGAAVALNITFPVDCDGYSLSRVRVGGLNSIATVDLTKDILDDDFYSDIEQGDITIAMPSGTTIDASTTLEVRFNIMPTIIAVNAEVDIAVVVTDSDGGQRTMTTSRTNSGSSEIAFERATYNTINCTFAAADMMEYWSSYQAESFASGSGSAADPYVISTAAQMAKLAVDVNGGTNYSGLHFQLACDISLDQYEWVPIGYSSMYSFQGTLDGAGYEISGLYTNNSSKTYQGLFGYIAAATIKNLGVSGEVCGTSYTGGITGYSDSSTIINCYNNASINGSGSYCGGIAAYSKSTTIANSYNQGSIVSSASGSGGIVGRNTSSSSIITNCYNSGKVDSSNTDTGAIAGRNASSSTIVSCYFDNTIYPYTAIGYDYSSTTIATGKTTTEMQSDNFTESLTTTAKTISNACAWQSITNEYPSLNFGVTP